MKLIYWRILLTIFLFSCTCVTSYYVVTMSRSFEYPCQVRSVINRTCGESQGILFMKENVITNNFYRGFINCGKVRNCETSPCNIKYTKDTDFFCYHDNDDIYELLGFPRKLLFLISLFCVFLFCCYHSSIEIFTYFRDKSLKTKEIEMENVEVK